MQKSPAFRFLHPSIVCRYMDASVTCLVHSKKYCELIWKTSVLHIFTTRTGDPFEKHLYCIAAGEPQFSRVLRRRRWRMSFSFPALPVGARGS